MKSKPEPGSPIPIPTLPNLRDLGGWATAGGRRVRWGVMYRSTDLDRFDAAGLADIARLGLRTVIDLRTEAERKAQPDHVPPGATQIICDVLADARDSAPAQLSRIMADPKHAGDFLGKGRAAALFENGYREIVALPSALAAYRSFFAALLEGGQRPLLFHCTTGKDRTGWAAAAVLTVLGVSREDIMRDYMLTNAQLLPALQPVIDRFTAAGGGPELLRPVLGVQPAYLEAAFHEAGRNFGSMEGYLTDGLGLDSAAQEHLRQSLTEERAA